MKIQVFQSGMDALVLSIVPGDIGKPTTKLEKTTVRDGTCRWENPVYETVKFIQEPKTGKISDQVYHFLVSTVGFFVFLLCIIYCKISFFLSM